MMHCEKHGVLGTSLFVEPHQTVEVQLFGIEQFNQVLITELGGVTVVFDMVFVLDGSSSIRQDNFDKIKQFVEDVVDGYEM